MNTALPAGIDGLVRGVCLNLWSAHPLVRSATAIGRIGRGQAPSPVAVTPAAVTEELTVCFVDLEGFTALTSRQGDEVASMVLRRHRRTIEPIVADRHGRIVQHLGDGTLLVFRDAADAVDAALTIVNAEDGDLRVRAGLHTGTVLVLPDGDVLGGVVNVAARVAASTSAGDVVVTAATAAAASTDASVQYVRPQRRRFKGVDGSVPTHRAVSMVRGQQAC